MERTKHITLDNDIYVGNNVLFLRGVTVGNKVVIGEGAVVTRNIPDNSVAVGVPVRVIKTTDKLIILGAGLYGREKEDVAKQMCKLETIFFLGDNLEKKEVSGSCSDFKKYIDSDTGFYPAFGDNDTREKWLSELKLHHSGLAMIVHPNAYISPTAKVGKGVAVLSQAIVTSYTEIKEGCIKNSGAIVDECSHICVGAIVKANNHIPAKMKIRSRCRY